MSDRVRSDTYAVSYSDGSFEDEVPRGSLRLKKTKQGSLPSLYNQRGGSCSKKQRNELLRDAANAGNREAVDALMREGASPLYVDASGFTPLHWVAGPESGMAGDTRRRLECVHLLAPVSKVDQPDGTELKMRAIQHAVAHNLVGVTRALAEAGADPTGTVHWAVNCRAHGVLRALLELGVDTEHSVKEWDWCDGHPHLPVCPSHSPRPHARAPQPPAPTPCDDDAHATRTRTRHAGARR